MKICRAALAALLLSATLSAAPFEGIAPTGLDGLTSARDAAIRDALENASLYQGADIKASSFGDTDTLRVRGQPTGNYTILREWQANGFYHVMLEIKPPAATAPAPDSKAPATQRCGLDYRRKALVTRLPVLSPSHLPDLARFPDEIQAELTRRLDASGHFLSKNSATEAAFAVQATHSEPQWNAEWIRDLARRYGVQFVVGGMIRDAGFEGERYTFSHGNDIRAGERKTEFNIPLLNFFKAGVKATPSARRFELDVFVFDGISGTLIQRHRLAGSAQGNIMFGGEMVMGAGVGTGTGRFFNSDFGQLVDAKLNEAVTTIREDIKCIPFSAKIVRVEAGRVYLDAGGTSRIAPGDRLQIYRLRPGSIPIAASGQAIPESLGWPEELAGTLTIKDVQPLFSTALPEGNLQVEVGDYVRFTGEGEKK